MRYLKSGEKVGIVAPGFAVKKERVAKGIACLRAKGFEVTLGRSVFKKCGYFAGTEEERAEDLNMMIGDPEIRGIFFARGGFGTSKILDRVDFEALARDPKPLVGYSDLTSLFLVINKRLKIPAFYGPVVVELGDRKFFDEKSLWGLLAGRSYRLKIENRWVISEGSSRETAEGVVEGGCLTLIANLIGTPHEPDFSGKILFWEEVGEESYRIDRLLHHLSMAGKLERLKGVVVGELADCTASKTSPGKRTIREILAEYFGMRGIPVLYGIPAGHCKKKITIPLGGWMRIDLKRSFMEFQGKNGKEDDRP